jgi:hypothetical protein
VPASVSVTRPRFPTRGPRYEHPLLRQLAPAAPGTLQHCVNVAVLVDAATHVNRPRLDALGGFWGGLKRAIVRSRARSAIGSSLIEARDLVERRYRMLTAA